jgi:hypothetical protein
MEHLGKKAILAVAQAPFDHLSESGSVNSFATLVPIMTADGELFDRSDFPQHGLVFWLVRQHLLSIASPGRLVTGRLEGALNPQAGHEYQISPDTAEIVQPSDAIEIVRVDNPAVSEPRDLVNVDSVLLLEHQPTPLVLVQWGGEVWGPFRTELASTQLYATKWALNLRTNRPDQKVFKIPAADMASSRFGPYCHLSLSAGIRTDNRDPVRYPITDTCNYSLLLGAGFRKLPSVGYPLVSVETDRELLLRYARRFTSKKDLQRLREILDAVDSALEPVAESPEEAERRAFEAIKRECVRAEGELSSLARSLIESGLIASHIADATEKHVQEYIQQQAATLSAEIDASVGAVSAELRNLERQRDSIELELDARRRQLTQEIDEVRESFAQQRAFEEEKIEKARQNLERERDALSRHLEQVIVRYTESRESVLNELLLLAPLLERAGLATGAKVSPVTESAPRPAPVPVQMPQFVTKTEDTAPALSELAFFDRFERHVKESGFSYRRVDLVAFHVSVKCCDITILGGPSGTGKSSLPALYAEALAGEPQTTDRYLHIGVSPAWLDMRDLLGHVNSLDRRFEPSETGLIRHLIYAHQEFARKQFQSGIYLATLDEMNLAHVEHYFSGFLSALEQKNRELRLFDSSSVEVGSLFSDYAFFQVPRSIRFVGTVNFDETTKQLSLRLLDRANLLHLRGMEPTALVRKVADQRAAVVGAAVRLQDFRDWRRAGVLDRELAPIWDRVHQSLSKLGAPITPRRQKAILEFIASTPAELAQPVQAFDLQIAQRLLPQVRGLYRPNAKETLEALGRELSQHSYGFPESVAAIRDLVHGEHAGLSMFDGSIL